MATQITPTRMLTILRAEGINVVEVPGWRDRCRCHNGSHEKGGNAFLRAWGNINGALQHITGGDLGKRTVAQYINDIINNDPSLPTKSQFVTAPNGDLHLNSVGRCNHAGKVGTRVREHMIAADFSLTDDHDDRFDGGTADGNAFTLGNEAIAAKTMTAAQRATSVLLWAAISRELGWTGQEVAGHGEVSTARGPADPNLHMGQFRRDVMARVIAGPGGTAPVDPVVPCTSTKPNPDEQLPPEPAPASGVHIVAKGDTLSRIAKATGLTVDDLVAWNDITNANIIRVGQALVLSNPRPTIPTPAPDPVPPVPPVRTKLAGTPLAQFGPGNKNAAVKLLGERLVAWGFGGRYKVGPTDEWGPADKSNTRDLQLSLGYTGSGADGLPGTVSLPFLDRTPVTPWDVTVIEANLAGTTMKPNPTGTYDVKGRKLADRVSDIVARWRKVGDTFIAFCSEAGDIEDVRRIHAELERRTGQKWFYATASENASQSLRLALFMPAVLGTIEASKLVPTAGVNHNHNLLVTVDCSDGVTRELVVVHYYHKSGAANDALRGKAAKATRGDLVAGDFNTAISDKGDQTEAALRKNALIDVERLAIKAVNASVNSSPGGKVVGRQIGRIAVGLGSIVREWGLLLDDDKTDESDHPAFAFARISLRNLTR